MMKMMCVTAVGPVQGPSVARQTWPWAGQWPPLLGYTQSTYRRLMPLSYTSTLILFAAAHTLGPRPVYHAGTQHYICTKYSTYTVETNNLQNTGLNKYIRMIMIIFLAINLRQIYNTIVNIIIVV